MHNSIQDGVITVFADSTLYTQEAIFKCLYWYGGRFHTTVSRRDSSTYQIQLKLLSTNPITDEEAEAILQKLERDLIDFRLRDIVSRETRNIRDLLVAKAFSHGEFDEEPPGELTDPVGFDVTQLIHD